MRILASDLDGTLVTDNKIIPENLVGLKKLRNAGNKFVISTGRSYNGVKKLISDYDLKYDYLVLCNGSLIIDGNEEVVYDTWISNDIAKDIINEFYDSENILIYFDNLDETILLDNPNVDKTKIQELLSYFSQRVNLMQANNIDCEFKILSLFASDGDASRVEIIKDKIIEKHGQYVEVYRNQYFLDIVPKDCSKGNALLKVLDIERKTENELFVIGDSYNDVPMFKITPNSYTFVHAEKNVKIHANKHVEYVYEAIDDLLN